MSHEGGAGLAELREVVSRDPLKTSLILRADDVPESVEGEVQAGKW